jgi:putative glycosyltransferase (TIGR04372 family)
MSILHRVFRWIGKLTGTIIIVPHPIAVGNCGEDIYYGLLKARKEGKKLVVLFPHELSGRLRIGIPNRELINFESEYRTFLPSNPLYAFCCRLITLYFAFFRGISIITTRFFKYRLSEFYTVPMLGQEWLWKPEPVVQHFSWDIVNAYEWANQTEQMLEISLARQSRSIAERQRKQMGLPADAWFVCLHVREGGYYKDHDSVERNADIANYIPAIREITRRGGWVVRMGDATMKRLPVMEQVIDYPFTPEKSELMDIYLLRECHTYLGMQSGILDVAIMFQRPIIQTNMYSWFLGYPQKKNDLGILKRVYSKSQKRFLSPMEWPLIPWAHQAFDPRENYEFHENSPEDLLNVVKEYFDRGTDWKPSALQLAFNELRLRKAREKLEQPLSEYLPSEDLYARYRLAIRLATANGMLGANFLLKYAALPNTPEAELDFAEGMNSGT